jgi:hypothetical protein
MPKHKDRDEGANRERREVLRAALYVAPVILTLGVTPHFAGSASGPGIDTYPPTSPDSFDTGGTDSPRGIR